MIVTVRGERVILDHHLARLYGVTTKALNQAVRRNPGRFPTDFVFQLSFQEVTGLRSQIVTSNAASDRSQFVTGSRGGRRYLPYAFTEHGALMAANVLNSPRAVQMSVFVVRAFIRMRAALGDTRELARKLAALERELKGRLDVHESTIVDILQRMMDLLDPPPLPRPRRRAIGFGVEEAGPVYRRRRLRGSSSR
ncbi:MAG: ORF6N domain-containing protein [candidate division NC10 bacterium]|nr:ORF6N domain-containing protein [candidate division NC10 bacterium]